MRERDELMIDQIDSIFPRRFVPPFRRNDWTVEEIIDVKAQLCGHYNVDAIANCRTRYIDGEAKREIEIEFRDGGIWMRR